MQQQNITQTDPIYPTLLPTRSEVFPMGEMDQVRPLAPASERPESSDNEEAALYTKADSKKRFIKCCGGITVFFLLLAIVVIILIFTVFKVKDPVITLNGVTVDELELGIANDGTTLKPSSNVTLTADVSVKNPNRASFKYTNSTTALFYHGVSVGEARGPPGKSKARRTMQMNITVEIITDKLISQPELISDVGSGLLPITSYTRIGGRVNLLGIIKKHVDVKLNCSITLNINSRSIQDQKCKRKVKV